MKIDLKRGFFSSCTGKPQEIAMFAFAVNERERERDRHLERKREGERESLQPGMH